MVEHLAKLSAGHRVYRLQAHGPWQGKGKYRVCMCFPEWSDLGEHDEEFANTSKSDLAALCEKAARYSQLPRQWRRPSSSPPRHANPMTGPRSHIPKKSQ